jgi:PAS domain S-box-containing protein
MNEPPKITTDPPATAVTESDHERQLREMNDALLVASVRQHELAEQAQTAEAGLRQSEARFRELVEQVKDYAIFRTDLEGRAITWNEGVARVLGFAEGEFIGMDVTQAIFTPEDIAAGVPQQEIETATRTGTAHDDRWMRSKDGRRFFALGTTTALKDEQGRVVGFSKVMRDHTRLKRTEDALRHSEEQLRRAIDAAPIPVILHAEDGEVLQISRSWTELTGYRIEDIPTFDAWLGNAYGFGAEAVRERVRELFQGATGMVQVEFEILTRVRERHVWAFSASSPGILRDGRRFVVGMAVDITERKRAEEHTLMLLREVSHRSKNLLAVVQAVARQSSRAEDPKLFVQQFSARVACLAVSQDLLVQNDWRGVDVGDLVRAQLSHNDELIGSRIEIDGPPVRVNPAAAQSLGMAVHELATNAAKYGALSNDGGTVHVSWDVSAGGGAPRYCMSWRECGGPPVATPSRRGFGHTVIGRMVRHALDAEVTIDFAPAGLDWRISAPAAVVVEGATQPGPGRGSR